MPEIIIKLGDQIVQKYYLYKDQISIGRAPENEIAIENLAVSRRHAEISKENGSYVLEDLNSANGTFVNGVQVTRTEIVDKDVIAVGKHKLYFYNQQVAAMQMVEKTMLVTRPAPSKAMLRVTRGKQKDQIFELNKAEVHIGRAADNEIRLGDWFVSKHHAEIVRKGLVYVVRDLASWRHTMVNGQIIDEQVLKPGDEIQFGPKIAMVFEVADGTAAREGSKRKPVELEEVDQPLPIAGSDPDPGTPLPIAGAARVSQPAMDPFPEAHDGSDSDLLHKNGVGANPQFDEAWDDEFDPEDYVGDDDSEDMPAADASAEEDAADFGEASEEQAEAGFEMAPVRLEDEADEISGGWGEAGARASGSDEADAFDAQSPRADASDSWSPEAATPVRVEGEDGDAVSEESSESVEWVEQIEAEVAMDSPADDAGPDAGGSDDAAVASLDEERLESDALPDGEAQDPATAEADDEPETSDVADDSGDEPVGTEAEGETPSPSEGDSLVDSIMESFGEEKGLVRSEIEMWVGALGNPSKVIRKQAQRQLQKLTGQVYDIEP